MNSLDFLKQQKQFDNALKNQAKFLKNYATSKLIMFIRASSHKDWKLHLASLHCLCKYFSTFDMVNYARLTLVYLTKMFSLKEEDPDTCQMFQQGTFSVNKTSIPFSLIGIDHAIKQENRAVKVLGGIKGIANNQKTFLLLPRWIISSKNFVNSLTLTGKHQKDLNITHLLDIRVKE